MFWGLEDIAKWLNGLYMLLYLSIFVFNYFYLSILILFYTSTVIFYYWQLNQSQWLLQSELVPSLGFHRMLTFYILIFISRTTFPNWTKLGCDLPLNVLFKMEVRKPYQSPWLLFGRKIENFRWPPQQCKV